MAPKSAPSRKAGKQPSKGKQSVSNKRVRRSSSAATDNRSTRPKQSKKKVGEKRKRKSDEPVLYKNFRLRPSVYSKWSQMSKSSQMFVKKMLEGNAMHVLSRTNGGDKETAAAMLNDLQTSLVSALRGLKVPKPAVTSHQTLQANRVRLERKLDQNTEQIHRLEEAIEEEDELLNQLEEEKRRLEQNPTRHSHTPTPNKHKVHPALNPSTLDVVPDSDDYGQLTALISAACHHHSTTLN